MDDYGQHDGDRSYGGSPFARAPGEQPWLRSSTPPWHMWGNSQTVQINSEAFGTFASFTNQLTSVRYKRPETWHWFFCARLLSVDPAPTTFLVVDLLLDFEVILGLGRSSVLITQPDPTGPQTSFERYRFQFSGTDPSLIGRQIWSNTVRAPNRDLTAGATPVENVIDEIVAQDIQLQARVSPGGNNNYVYRAQMQIDAYWAPKSHVRPDWFHPTGPLEQQFPGDEISGT